MSEFEKIPKGIFNKVDSNKEIFISEFKDKLQEIFPTAVKDGIVDFEALLNEFGKYAETDEKEKYNMTWVGKKEAIRKANEDIVGKTLKYVPGDSKNPDTTQNLYIEGDNLEVLKLLRNSYYGKVKMIYIDPPYNTDNDFIYNDSFKIDKDEYEKAIGDVNEYNERMTVNKKGSGRYHSKWLNMMYPRLKVAKDLLKNDGVIFISIDDNEVASLTKMCDEIFGEDNFVGNIAWESKTKSQNTSTSFNKLQPKIEHILLYTKSSMRRFNLIQKGVKEYLYSDERGEFRWLKIEPMNAKGIRGRETMIYPIMGIMPPNGKQWQIGKDKIEKLISVNDVKIENEVPYVKMRPTDERSSVTEPFWAFFSKEIGTAESAKKELSSIIENHGFETVKPINLIKRLVFHCCDKSDVMLDFFSGSGTSAQAVMELNSEYNKDVKYILVQLPEPCDIYSGDIHIKNICEIAKKRIHRAGDKILEDNKEKEGIENLDIGFKVFKVADTNIKWISDTLSGNYRLEDYKGDLSSKDKLDFNPHFADIDVVYEMMLKRQDIELTERIDKLDYIGNRTYLVGYTILVCLEENITEEMVKKISEIDTTLSWIVFRDSAFNDDINLKTNTMNLLRTLITEKNPKNKNQKILWI
ncbi:site-specific DNA-methyltransferase [Clostridium sp. DL1XJH146]